MSVITMILKPFKGAMKMIMKAMKAPFKTPMRMMFSIMLIVIALVIVVAMKQKSAEQFTQEQAEELNPINNKTIF